MHDHFVGQDANHEQTQSIWDELSHGCNFDMLRSYLAVCCGNQHRSYHGTTVQIVQPKNEMVVI